MSCVSGKKKSQENKNKGNKTENIELKTDEPYFTSVNMRDSAEGELGGWTCVTCVCGTSLPLCVAFYCL